ncbi:MAG: phosphatase PAP2 family protein [Bradymonadaceae bacterium]|nr:phosphatase PAP2 family protein [Lujinxingiaceae bacterium]
MTPAHAQTLQAGEPDPDTVPLLATYSPTELVLIGALYPSSMLLITLGGHIFSQPIPSMSAPLPGSFDYRISEGFHGDLTSGKPLFLGIPDQAAYALAALPMAYYAGSSVYRLITGSNFFEFQGTSVHHSTLAFAEAYGWTAFLTTVAKFMVGRPRPYVALDRPAFAWNSEEENLSFFSGHASLSFAAATFLFLDISDGAHARMGDEFGTFSRFLIGTALPFTSFYGLAALISVSRIYDQKHYFSDVLIGAMAGTLTASLVYALRFDSRGVPHRRRILFEKATTPASASALMMTPTLVSDGQSVVPGWGAMLQW